MSRPLAAALSMLLPGPGQLAAGRPRRAAALLLATVALAVLALLALRAERVGSVDRRLLAGVLGANALLLAFRLFAVVDAWRLGRGAITRTALAALALVVAATAVPHVAAAYVAVRGYTTLETVFAD